MAMTSLSEKLLANKRFAFTSDAFSEDKFEVVTMQGYESISRPFRFELTLVSDDADIDFEQMLQSQVAFTIYAPDGMQPTPYYGMVAEFDQLHESGGYIFYRVVMVPRIWQLSLYQVSEVYLEEKPIPALIKQVLESANFNSNDFEIKTNGQYRDRSFVCQYQESHLDFISRWLEKEGMYYWFDHAQKNDKIIIADDKVMHAPGAVQVNYRPVDELDTGVAPDSVQSFSCRQKPLPKQVILQDFNHRKASTELKATATVSEKGIGEVMFYGENFRTNEEGERYANLRAQEILARSKIFMGESTAVGLRCGFFMQLNHHFRDAFNSQYLITEIEHQGSQAGALLNGIRTPYNTDESGAVTSYSNSFQAIAADTQYRPERITPKPKVAGTMNAVIDAEGSGEYADLDEFGQYKVQLPFDRTDKKENKGSTRIRMASPYAGNGHGMHFPLHKKTEVVLSFTDGDPDQPVILSAVSNSENENVVSDSDPLLNKIKTASGNGITMSDAKGSEGILFASPNSNTVMALGALLPDSVKNLHGLTTFTEGSDVKFVKGNSLLFSLSADNKMSIGVENSLSLAHKNELSIASKLGVGVGLNTTAEWGGNISFNDASSIDLSRNKSLNSLESVSITAGYKYNEEMQILNSIKSILKGAFTTNLIVNGLVAGEEMGKLVNLVKDMRSISEGEYKGVLANDHNANEILAKQFKTMGASALIQAAMIGFAKLYEKSISRNPITKLEMGDNGFSVKNGGEKNNKGEFLINNGSVKINADNSYSVNVGDNSFILGKSGISIKRKSISVIWDNDGFSIVNGDKKFVLDSNSGIFKIG